MFHRSLLLFFLFAIANFTQAQTWSLVVGTQQRDEGLVIRPTIDGGAIASGEAANLIVKLNAAGKIDWVKKGNFGPAKSIFVLKNGYIISDRRGHVFKLNLQGDVLWSHAFGVEVRLTSLIKVSGGYVFALSSTNAPFQIIKIAADGKIVWSRQYLSENCASAEFTQIQKGSRGEFLVAGTSCFQDTIRLVTVDSLGKIVWKRDYQTPNFNVVVRSLKRTFDGGHIVAADIFGAGNNATLLMKVDRKGNIEWQKAYNGNLFVRSIILKQDGYTILADSIIFQVDSGGNIIGGLHPRLITTRGEDGNLLDLQRSKDGGYFASGKVKRPEPNFTYDFWILKVNESFEAPAAQCVINRDVAPPETQSILANVVNRGAIHSRKIRLNSEAFDPALKTIIPIVTACN